MLFNWLNTRELDEFADSLVARLIENFPPAGDPPSGKKAFERMRRLFGGLFDRIDGFVQANRLNLYKKAHFANRVRWALRDAGYPPEFVETMTQEVVTHLTAASRR